MHIQHIGIERTWKQPILNSPNYFRVFVWDNAEAMCCAFDKDRNKIGEHNFIGRCVTFPQGISGNKRSCGKKFAEVHFVREYVGAGMVAHEFYHLINYWSGFKNWHPQDNQVHDERVALLTGRIVSRFWKEFYKRYKSDEPLT